MALSKVNPNFVNVSQYGRRNLVINGDMRIDQRNVGASVNASDGTFGVDRFSLYSATALATKGDFQQNAGSVTPPTGFSNYLGFTSTSSYAIASGEGLSVQQRIEGYYFSQLGWGFSSAKSATLSFWVRSSLTGTFGGSIRNAAGNRSYPFTYTISSANTWEYKSITIPGETNGTWEKTNGVGAYLFFGLGVGSSLSGTAGVWATANHRGATGATSVVATNAATFYLTGVQLEVGDTATPFEHRSYGEELSLCHRYYQDYTSNTGSGIYLNGTNEPSSEVLNARFLPVVMRASPSVVNATSTSGTVGGVGTDTRTLRYFTANGHTSGGFSVSFALNSEL
jgi:hypothetical protein